MPQDTSARPYTLHGWKHATPDAPVHSSRPVPVSHQVQEPSDATAHVAAEAFDGATPAPQFVPFDSLFASQWHLRNIGQFGGTPGIDINVTKVWDEYTGHGVYVGVFDDGIQYDHPDLVLNYDSSRHITIDGVEHDPFPVFSSDNHGTSVAGLIAASNDGVGTVGVAYDARLTGVKLLSNNFSEADWFEAVNQQSAFDVVNHSWGFIDLFVDTIAEAEIFLAGASIGSINPNDFLLTP